MKATLPLLLLPALVSFANAATINVSNYRGSAPTTSSVIFNQANQQIAGGYAAIGYFNVADTALVTSSGAELSASFQQFGLSGGTNRVIAGAISINGVFEFSGSAPTLAGNPFIGQSVYLIVGNAASLALSSQAFIYKTSTLFPEDPATPVSLNFSVGPPPGGTLILGQTGVTGTVALAGSNSTGTTTAGYRTANLIPEPSAALLGAFAALGLLRRRRN